MEITLNKTPHELRFRHTKLNSVGSYSTMCQILVEEQIIGEGIAVCSNKDQFSRSKGRKIALARAMEDFSNKSIKTEVWKQYFKIIGVNYDSKNTQRK